MGDILAGRRLSSLNLPYIGLPEIQCTSHTALASILTHSAPHRTPRWVINDRQNWSRDPPSQIVVQLCPVIQEVWGDIPGDDIPQASITRLIPFKPRRCRVVHKAHGLSHQLLTLLHLTVCCTEQNAPINFGLINNDSQQIADSTYNFAWQF